MSMVPSVEALSTTMTSLRGYFWASTDSRQRLMNRPLSYVTIVTETKSLCAMNENLSVRACYTPFRPEIIWSRTEAVRPPSRTKSNGWHAARLSRKLPRVEHFGTESIPPDCAAASPPQRPDTPPERQAGGNVWLNTSVDYDTNKCGVSLLLASELCAPRYESPGREERNIIDDPDQSPAGRNPHPQTRGGKSLRRSRPTRATRSSEPSETPPLAVRPGNGRNSPCPNRDISGLPGCSARSC